ncbi:MAG: hypothetical protein IT204_16780 [Fimbriimonadaceae bacterium]|nr:hypothetical protein [Fimbriimonadaceae bacterium]
MKRVWLGMLLTVALAHSPAAAVVLRYKYESGEKNRYRDQVAMAFAAETKGEDPVRWQFRSESLLEQKVEKVDGERYQIHYQTLENSSAMQPEDGKAEKSEHLGDPERIKMTSRGRVLERKTLAKDDDSEPGMGYTTKLDEFAIVQQIFDHLEFPERDVNAGDKWEEHIKVDLTPDDPKVRTFEEITAVTRLERLVTINGKVCAELVTDFEVPLRTPKDKESSELGLSLEGTILGHLTTYFDIEGGQSVVELATLGALGKMTMAPSGGQKLTVGGKLKVNIKTVLVD